MERDEWMSHEDVLEFEQEVMAGWYQWFITTGILHDPKDGFVREVRKHYRKIAELVLDTL